ncbi:unnamed protein product [Danaus chrysippus]|uniref:(African queen) hypothetical protein n=1 Tax=Danaus chrysippus TaxID=151541 RepID=A0A8J2VWA1_9NEOP|nr:unnamed protein product [Danaus chrysippus]
MPVRLYEYIKKSVQPRNLEDGQDVYNYDGVNFVGHTLANSTFLLQISPRAFAISGNKGVAISNPISSVIVRPGEVGSIVHKPQAVAIVGPGGIAHAESELNVYDDATQYIPFYGGAKGQYLEVKKDTRGTVLSEKVVAEKSISPEHINKNNNDNVLSKILAVNLENLRTLSSSLIKLQNLGRKTGALGTQEKAKFKSDLLNLGEAASNTIKLIDEVADDIDVLFKKNTTILRNKQEDDYYDDVGEEGIGIDSAAESEGSNIDKSLVAEAKPVGLAVIAESGIAASRPMGTAVATSGVAIARPIGTAIAGIDPSLLGIDFNAHHSRKLRIKGRTY